MFREMRRAKQLLSLDESKAIMDCGTNGTLACYGDNGYPYGVPLNYVYDEGKLYFHSAKVGEKIDGIIKNPKVSFTVVDEDTIVSEEYTSYYRSAIAFGKARIVEGDEWFEGFNALVEKYSGDQPKESKDQKIRDCNQSHIIAIDVEHLTGKQAKEYVGEKEEE